MGASHLGVLLWAIFVQFYVKFAERWSWNGWNQVYCCQWYCNGCFIDNLCCRSCNNWFCADLCWWFWNGWFSVECCDGLEFIVIQLFKICCCSWWWCSCNELFCVNFLPCSGPNPLHWLGSTWDDVLRALWATGSTSSAVSVYADAQAWLELGALEEYCSAAGSLSPCNFLGSGGLVMLCFSFQFFKFSPYDSFLTFIYWTLFLFFIFCFSRVTLASCICGVAPFPYAATMQQ